MQKTKYTTEYEINASTKMIFPYLSTPSGLAEWFADKVKVDDDKSFHFIWDGKTHVAKKVAQKGNTYVKFEFVSSGETKEKRRNSYIEFALDNNELTQTSFLKIIDYCDDDPKDLKELWNNLVDSLKESLGAN